MRRAASTDPDTDAGLRPRLRLLAGRYQVGELIGRGGMADVHSGTDTRLGRTVAIKLLKPSLSNDPVFRTRFRQEAQAAARMAHPTIVRVFDAGEETVLEASGAESQLPFIVMEFVDGKLLKDIIGAGPLEPAQAVHVVEGILTALEYSHRSGVVHRDVKPGNIMITRAGQVKVMDFGIARAISDSSATVAQTSAILGTAQYFSPEQARGETVDARTDLYSTGVVLFEMLTGRPPFRGDTAVSVAYQHVSEPPPMASTLNPRVSPALDSVLSRALRKDRFDRYQSAAEFRADVSIAASGRVPAPKLPAADPAASLFGSRPSTPGPELALKQLAVDDDTVHRTQNRPPAVWVWAGFVGIAVIILAVVFWVLSLAPNSALPAGTRVVPTIVGMPYSGAEAALTSAGLAPNQLPEPNQTVPKGNVIRSEPAAGTKVAPGTKVDVRVSSGPAQVTVPPLIGLDQGAATTALKQATLDVGAVTKQHSPTVPAGVVLGSDPTPGTSASAGQLVALTVSDGQVTLPDVRGTALAEAKTVLEGPELQLRVRVQPTSGCGAAADLVIGQSLAPGAVPQLSEVVLTYCNGR